MKDHAKDFFPGNSGGVSAWNPIPTIKNMFEGHRTYSGCTYGSHTANDNDVLNVAAHITMDETESFWKGNDYYVYDGKDVYWGTVQLVGEIALAILSMGASAEVSLAREAATTTTTVATATTRALKAQKAMTLAKRAEQLSDAANASINAYRVQKGTALGRTLNMEQAKRLLASETVTRAMRTGTPAEQVIYKAATAKRLSTTARADATVALRDYGVTLRSTVGSPTGAQFGGAADTIRASGVTAETTSVTTTVAGMVPRLAWASAMLKPWRLVKPGLTALKPKNVAKLFGPGVSWGKRFKRATITIGGIYLGTELIKAFGYSAASVDKYTAGVPFNAFGLLSGDNNPNGAEGQENVVSHGMWVMFEEGGAAEEDDPVNEALAFAEAFRDDLDNVNQDAGGLCDVDIYVVQPGISNPKKLGKKEVYYIIQNPGKSLRVDGV
jgi:hypothetical protein